MSKEMNLATLGRIAEAVSAGNFDLFKETVSIECIDHDPAVGQVAGPAGYRMFFTGLRNAFPDLSVALEMLVADEESIAFAYTIRGTQTGPLVGFAPTVEHPPLPKGRRFPSSRLSRDGGGFLLLTTFVAVLSIPGINAGAFRTIPVNEGNSLAARSGAVRSSPGRTS